MKTRYTNKPYYDNSQNHNERYKADGKSVSQGQWYYPVFNITLIDLVQRLFMGIKRLLVALKYQFYKKTNYSPMDRSDVQGTGKWKIPWFKIGLVGLVLFIFTQKDFQFSINMKAPKAVPGQEDMTDIHADASGQGMNIAQAISFKDRKKTSRNAGSSMSVDLNDQDVEVYIKRFRKVAMVEMQKFGIPASVKMAWGILESEAGQKSEASINNNHFGYLMQGQPFTTAWENWRAHSLLLQANYSGLFHIGNNYSQWIKALDKAKVSADPDFDKNLLNIIEKYQLDRLDQEFMN